MLDRIYAELCRQAGRTGQDRGANLSGGARIAVRVREGTTIVTFSRRRQRLGDRELITFCEKCRVPRAAERIPKEGQGQRDGDGQHWFFVAYRWKEEQ